MRTTKATYIKEEGCVGKYIDPSRVLVPEKARSHMRHIPFGIVKRVEK